jgi:CheY-like chemotaxis protein
VEVEPDVVVTDYRMPLMDGVALLKSLGGLLRLPRMVVYSAEPPPKEFKAHRARGVKWVAKSPRHAALLELLEEMLRA